MGTRPLCSNTLKSAGHEPRHHRDTTIKAMAPTSSFITYMMAITGEGLKKTIHTCAQKTTTTNSSSNTQPRSLPNRTVSTPLHTLESPRPSAASQEHLQTHTYTLTLTLTPQHPKIPRDSAVYSTLEYLRACDEFGTNGRRELTPG